jgi:arylsulfatase A-like enzyme
MLLLLPWLALGLAEVAFALGAVAQPPPLQLTFELALLLLAGLLQARLAPPGLWRSPALPAILAISAAAILHRPAGLVSTFAFGVGVVVLSVVAARIISERLRPGPFLGVALALAAAVLARYEVLGASRVQDPRRQLLSELHDAARLPTPPGPDRAPILLISVDTLRWDHAVEMDSFQRLASRGRSFPRAMASTSWTLPSMASAHTGLPAHAHGAVMVPGAGVSAPGADTDWLAEQLSAAGWHTGAIVTNPYLSSAMGFNHGFRDFLHVNERAPHRLTFLGLPWGPREWEGEIVLRRAQQWLSSAPDSGWFLWVHFLDTHLPYRHAPPGHVGRSGSGAALRSGQLFSPTERTDLIAGYAHEVSVVDGFITALLDAAPDANVVLMADHGEEWWDHGGMEHGHSHHGEVVDVALALAGPDVSAQPPDADGGVASVQDVYATVLGLAGVPLPPTVTDSLDLRAPIPPSRFVLASGNLYNRIDWSARQDSRRLIVRGDQTPPEAFDLTADPTEQHPLPVSPDDPLLQAIESARAAQATGAQQDQNDEALRALGYIE